MQHYVSTRNAEHRVLLGEAIARGIAPDGGLYVPEQFPHFVPRQFDEDVELPEIAARLLAPLIAEDLARVRAAVDLAVPDDVVVRALTAWAGLYGTVSFELFGQFANTVEDDRAAYFDHTMTLLGRLVGLKS